MLIRNEFLMPSLLIGRYGKLPDSHVLFVAGFGVDVVGNRDAEICTFICFEKQRVTLCQIHIYSLLRNRRRSLGSVDVSL